MPRLAASVRYLDDFEAVEEMRSNRLGRKELEDEKEIDLRVGNLI